VKRIFLLVLALLPAQAVSRVVDFHSDIRIARSGELAVTERITLEVDDRHPHSVLRRELRGPATVSDVIRNGHPEVWTLEADAGSAPVRLRFARPVPHRMRAFAVPGRS